MAVWIAALAALACGAAFFRSPGFMDAYYYYHVAANLAAGRGFTEDVVWNYLTNAPAVTHPSNLYWMPATALLMAPAMLLLGESFRIAQVPVLLLSAAVPAATAVVAYLHLRSAFKAGMAAALTLFAGYYFVYWTALDSFALFALAAGGMFLASGRAASATSVREALGPGAVMGGAGAVAHLARADGPLLLAAAALALLVTSRGSNRQRVLWTLLAAATTYLAAMAPWFLRNIAVAGAPLSSGGAVSVFLTEYNEIFSYELPLTLDRYLQQGLPPILEGKLAAALRNLGVLFGLEYWLIPFAVLGWWRLRHWAPLTPALVYGVLLYAVMTLIFTFPSGRGSMLHSGVALVPWLAIAAVEGIEVAVQRMAARLSHWRPQIAYRNFTLIFVGISVLLCGYLTLDQAREWHRQGDSYAHLAPYVPDASAVVMASNPPAWWYGSKQRSIQAPTDGPEAALAAASRYGARYLVLEPARARAWKDFEREYRDDARFTWIAGQDGYDLYRMQP